MSPRLDLDFVNVHGSVPSTALAPHLDRAHVLGLPTLDEPFGVAFVEALSAGIPVFGSDTGNVPWIVDRAGVTPCPRSPSAMSAAMADILAMYPVYASAAFERGAEFRTSWTWNRVARELVAPLGIQPPALENDLVRRTAPCVCAVVVTHNRHDVLIDTLACVLAQTRPPDRVLVVDNASSDDTAKHTRKRFPGAVVLSMDENLGPSGGIAAGIRDGLLHGADYIWLVEDDSLYGPTYLEQGLNDFEAEPGLAMLGAGGWDFDGKVWRGASASGPGLQCGVLPTLDGAIIRRAAALQVGYPNASFFMMIQDVEYPLRMREQGHATAVDPLLPTRPLRHGAASSSGIEFRAYYQTRNHLRMALDRSSFRMLQGFVRRTVGLCSADIRRPHPWRVLAMRFAGIVDALGSISGRTVEPGQPWPGRRRRRTAG